MMTIHNSHVGSKPRERGAAVCVAGSALTVTSVSERVAPVLDRFGDALVDLLVGRMELLHLVDRLLALGHLYLRPHRHGEMLDVDLRGLDRIEIFHEELGG